ncbi:hypothetical protein DPMN_083509 [Dreissena polymorpha]|uniref:Uncharacterized protein n=1 Tax=Dreissena polymorpha TaxID=45954 RepID=A0A9D3YCT0_DREPO|nr:hypothetical protein DPMN_083509 [Dreissena polymorpha]
MMLRLNILVDAATFAVFTVPNLARTFHVPMVVVVLMMVYVLAASSRPWLLPHGYFYGPP